MPRFLFSLAIGGAAVAFATGANATATNVKSYLASYGTSVTCTRTSPCGSFAIAHDATVPRGEIVILDSSAGYNAIVITKSLTVRAETPDGGSHDTGGGIFVTVSAGPNDVVRLEGLRFGGAGIQFNSGAQLHVINCILTGNTTAGGSGIKFQPNGASRLSVIDSVIDNNGSGTGGGIIVNPQAGGSAQVSLERVSVNGNAFGIAADGTGSSGGINMTIADSMISGNAQDGIVATTPGGGAPIGVLVTNTKSVNNNIGIRSIGPNVTVRVESSKVTGNGTGLSFIGGGALLTFGNNAVRANGSDGAFSGSVGLQ